MEYVSGNFTKAKHNYWIVVWRRLWERLLCSHVYKQTHPKIYEPDPTGFPKPMPSVVVHETKGEVWLYDCTKCGKHKAVPIKHIEQMSKQFGKEQVL